MRMKTMYMIEYNSQVLTHGAWGSPDCAWRWDSKSEYFDTEEEAAEKFRTLSANDDTPIIRLYKVVHDRFGEVDRELIDELN